MSETTWLDATAQADLVRRGEASPAELAEAAIARIEAVNPKLDAVIRTRFDAARREAAGELPDGPFRGVPILFKDLGCLVAGEAAAFGVGPLRDVAWPLTSYLAAQFLAAGHFGHQAWLTWAAVPIGLATGVALTAWLGDLAVGRLETRQVGILRVLADAAR